MVRVISVYNFPRQDVSAVEEVTVATVAPPDYLLLALKSHTILIYDSNGKEKTRLPTVDQVYCICYSSRGSYIATLEARGEVRFVRTYLGWENAGGSAPLRARIAGRVTPLSQQAEAVEMIEVPSPGMPDCIAVCSVSGNLIISCGASISIYRLVVKPHDISRVLYSDFLKTKWNLDLNFTPTSITICEDILSAFNDRCLHIMRISQHSSVPFVDPDLVIWPSVAMEPQLRQTPFLISDALSVNLVYDNPADELLKSNGINIKSFIQIQLTPCLLGGSGRHDVLDAFTCVKMRPYYHSSVKNQNDSSLLGSSLYQNLYGMAWFFGTQQEGYLYHFSYQSEEMMLSSVYPVTAPLVDVALDDALLHALTTAGLETYTLRVPAVEDDGDKQSVHDDPICLLGLRPFFQVKTLILGIQQLYLLTGDGSGPGTLYRLGLPEPSALWADFLTAAEQHRWDAPAIYSHLLREAHHILKTRRGTVKLEMKLGEACSDKLEAVNTSYKHSCLLLGDLELLSESYNNASFYYSAAGLRPNDLVRHIKLIFQQLPASERIRYPESQLMHGLVFILRESLRKADQNYLNFEGNRENFYNSDLGILVSAVLDVVESEDPNSLADLILESPVIQNFASDRSLGILSSRNSDRPADLIALALVSLQRGQHNRGQGLMASLPAENLKTLLVSYGHILLDNNGLSELTQTLLPQNAELLADVLFDLNLSNAVPLAKVQPALLEIIQSGGSLGAHAAQVLQILIERQLQLWVDEDRLQTAAAKEAACTLTCLYLTQLSQRRETPSTTPLFRSCRPRYLDNLPPFGPDLAQILSPQSQPTNNPSSLEHVLLKLQCLLASEVASEALFRVRVLVTKTPHVLGSLSIQVQCAGTQEALQLLLNFAPQALLPYIKDYTFDEHEWKFLIEHLRNKLSNVSQESKRKFYYEQLERGVLEHMARVLPVSTVIDLIPLDHPARSHCLRVAHDNEQAKHIRTVIMLTGSHIS